MKKTLIAIILALTATTAQAVSISKHVTTIKTGHQAPVSQAYNIGYQNGKSDAYFKIGRTMVFVGVATIAGVVIYHIGKDSRWSANENGVIYRF